MNSPLPPKELIEAAAHLLGDIRERVTFLGGAALALLITDPAARPPRFTADVDVVIELASLVAFYELDAKLKARGFANALEGPLCRFTHGSIVLDVMPTDPDILGFSNRWYRHAIESSASFALANGVVISVVSPACFLATKFDAFDSTLRQDHGDMFASRDFEDVVTLLDGRATIIDDILNAHYELRQFLQERFRALMTGASWQDGIEAHVEEGRGGIVEARIISIVNGTTTS